MILGFGLAERTYFTKCELEYSTVEDKRIDDAIELLKTHLLNEEYDFTEDELEMIGLALALAREE